MKPRKSTRSARLFLNIGKDFLKSARMLVAGSERLGKMDLPAYFLFSHSIELLVKSIYHAMNGFVLEGHDSPLYFKACLEKGLKIPKSDLVEIENAIEALYKANEDQALRYFLKKSSVVLPSYEYLNSSIDKLIQAIEPVIEEVEPLSKSNNSASHIILTFSKPK